MINCIADSSILGLLQPSPPLLIPSLLSVTVTLPLILSSNTPTEVFYPPVISYQLWLPSLWSSVGILAPSRLPPFSKRGATCMKKWKGHQVLPLPTTSVGWRKKACKLGTKNQSPQSELTVAQAHRGQKRVSAGCHFWCSIFTACICYMSWKQQRPGFLICIHPFCHLSFTHITTVAFWYPEG